MTRYLIEVPHADKKEACERAVRAFMETGSHFMTHADWGCSDDEHKAWITVELDSKEEARSILPPNFRQDAKIVALEQFSMDDLERTMDDHKD